MSRKQDRPADIAARVVSRHVQAGKVVSAVVLESEIARKIRAEVRRAVKPWREALDACDWSYDRSQPADVQLKIDRAQEHDPFK